MNAAAGFAALTGRLQMTAIARTNPAVLLERQLDVLTAAGCRVPGAGCRKIFADNKHGKDALRPELKAMLATSGCPRRT
ncbi:hypothetical protein OHA28_49905 [Streptomyces sp. NBC_00269]|uniref:hypothetical protein n=1 Tax=Streptomyces sp. NBC_00269 TaxID=2975696 RepID=UPI002E2C82FB|nr:hypothetical protein [Streptomyces sp. NBC_00269]